MNPFQRLWAPSVVVAVVVMVPVATAAESASSSRIPMDNGVMLHSKLAPEEVEIIVPQSFVVALPVPGAHYFVSAQVTDEHGLPKVEFRILDAEGATLQTLAPTETWSSFEGVLAVAFRDMNGDGIPDITVITSWTTGIGPEGVVPFHAASLYLFDSDAGHYVVDTALLKDALPLYTQSIDHISAYIEGTRITPPKPPAP